MMGCVPHRVSLGCIGCVLQKLDFRGFSFKPTVLRDYWELEAHIYTSKTSDSGPKRLSTVFATVANKQFSRAVTTVKVIFPCHGTTVGDPGGAKEVVAARVEAVVHPPGPDLSGFAGRGVIRVVQVADRYAVLVLRVTLVPRGVLDDLSVFTPL